MRFTWAVPNANSVEQIIWELPYGCVLNVVSDTARAVALTIPLGSQHV